MTAFGDHRIHRRLIDTLYVEAMTLADEARSYFDEGGRADRDALSPMERVAFSCESLKVTTRLMHIIAWLLTQRAVDAGELTPTEAMEPARRLGASPAIDTPTMTIMPPAARGLVTGSADLHRRVARLDAAQGRDTAMVSPARSIQDRLALALG